MPELMVDGEVIEADPPRKLVQIWRPLFDPDMIAEGAKRLTWEIAVAEEAARFYTSVFKNAKMGKVAKYGEAGAKVSGKPKGSTMTVEFEIAGQKFIGLNGGPEFKFSEALSFVVNCGNQREVDEYWTKLSAGGSEGPCGWLKDKFGLSWQIVPTVLEEMLTDEDPEKAERVMAAMLLMKKLDIAALEAAYEGTPAGVGR